MDDRPFRGRPGRPAWACAAAALVPAVGMIALALPGSHRGYDYDEAVTVANFVVPGRLAFLRRQIGYNNHILFSFVERLVYEVTRSASELTMRLAPILIGAAAVALLGWAVARRWGPLPGAAAALALACNPLFLYASREARGYSLLVFFAVASTLALARLLADAPRSRRNDLLYVACLAGGLATHLYMTLVLLGHVALVLAHRPALRPWVARWAVGVFLGLLPYAAVARVMVSSGTGGTRFRLRFPVGLLGSMLGVGYLSWPMLVGNALLLGFGAWPYRRRLDAWVVAATELAALLGIWLVVRPAFLYVRFFVWLAPAAALAVGAAVRRHRALVALVALVVALEGIHALGTGSQELMPVRLAAEVVRTTESHGARPCVVGGDADAVLAYARRFVRVRARMGAAGFARCDVALWILRTTRLRPPHPDWSSFPYRYQLEARAPGLAVSRRPLPCQVDLRTAPPTIVRCPLSPDSARPPEPGRPTS
jgi:hypothetical protein